MVASGNTNGATWALAKSLYVAYSKAGYIEHEHVPNGFSTNLKINSLYAFNQAINKLGGVDTSFQSGNISANYEYSGEDNSWKTVKAYGDEVAKYSPIAKSNTNEAEVTNGTKYDYYGPFKLSFSGGEISKVSIYNGTFTAANDADKVCDSEIKWGYSPNYKNTDNSINSIPSSKDFYIRVKKDNEKYKNLDKNKIRIRFTQGDIKAYRVRLILLGKKLKDAQNIGIFAGKETNANASITYKINDNSDNKITITIEKVDDYGKTVKEAGFKIKVSDNNNYWLKKDAKGNFTYNNSFSNATIFSTNNEGKIELKNLSTKYNYKIFETKRAGDSFLKFADQINTDEFSSTINGKEQNVKLVILDEDGKTWKNGTDKKYTTLYCGKVDSDRW